MNDKPMYLQRGMKSKTPAGVLGTPTLRDILDMRMPSCNDPSLYRDSKLRWPCGLVVSLGSGRVKMEPELDQPIQAVRDAHLRHHRDHPEDMALAAVRDWTMTFAVIGGVFVVGCNHREGRLDA